MTDLKKVGLIQCAFNEIMYGLLIPEDQLTFEVSWRTTIQWQDVLFINAIILSGSFRTYKIDTYFMTHKSWGKSQIYF